MVSPEIKSTNLPAMISLRQGSPYIRLIFTPVYSTRIMHKVIILKQRRHPCCLRMLFAERVDVMIQSILSAQAQMLIF